MTEAAEAVRVAVPSGQPVTLQEVLVDENPGEVWVRFRFVAPDIARGAGRVTHDVAVADIDHLCQNFAIAYLDRFDLHPARVVVSLADRATTFGKTVPEATQFFEVFRVEGSRCVWEEY